tara:strand:- start:171 stop:296 length:126 start_codon:yes stop_codon:yes gene_type:complete
MEKKNNLRKESAKKALETIRARRVSGQAKTTVGIKSKILNP